MEEKPRIQNIVNGKNSAIIIKNFYDKNSCKKACTNIKQYSIHNYEEGVIKKIGVFLSAYLQRPNDYFKDVQKSKNKVNKIFFNLENPLEKIRLLLSESFQLNVSIANENGMEYSSGVIRIHEKGDYAPLHRDNAKFEASAYSVSKFNSQISCVLHLQNSEIGGELKIYKQFWKKQDEKFRNPGFGYSKKVLESNEFNIIKPESGDLIIINPLYYHEILPVQKSKRISFGTFFGFSKNFSESALWA